MGFRAYGEPLVANYQRMKLHTEDAATLTHWPLQDNRNDSVGSNNWSTGPDSVHYQRVNGLDNSSDLLTFSTRNTSIYAAPANNPDIKTLTAITVACWACITENPSGNLAIIGMRGPGPGAPYNFPWELGYQAGSGVRFFWQSGTKVYEGTTPVLLTNGFGRWHHLIGTRNSASSIARVYMNGALVDEATGLSPWSGGANQNSVEFFTNALSTNLNGQMFTGIIKNTYADTATAAALYADALEFVE